MKCYGCHAESGLARSTKGYPLCDECFTVGCAQLDTVPAERLFDELKMRCRSCVFVFEREGKQAHAMYNGFMFWGSLASILGLLMYGVRRVKKIITRHEAAGESEGSGF